MIILSNKMCCSDHMVLHDHWPLSRFFDYPVRITVFEGLRLNRFSWNLFRIAYSIDQEARNVVNDNIKQ